jgi:hypothetical protein
VSNPAFTPPTRYSLHVRECGSWLWTCLPAADYATIDIAGGQRRGVAGRTYLPLNKPKLR